MAIHTNLFRKSNNMFSRDEMAYLTGNLRRINGHAPVMVWLF